LLFAILRTRLTAQ